MAWNGEISRTGQLSGTLRDREREKFFPFPFSFDKRRRAQKSSATAIVWEGIGMVYF